MITLLRPERMPVATGVCLCFTACARGREFDSRVDGGKGGKNNSAVAFFPCLRAFFKKYVLRYEAKLGVVCLRVSLSGVELEERIEEEIPCVIMGRCTCIIKSLPALCLYAAQAIPSAKKT